jgi:hypothetical protein
LLNVKTINRFLFIFQAVGGMFISVFLAAYLGGLFMKPSTTVLHSELAFRVPLAVFGVAFLLLILAGTVLAAYRKK